ncbi:hypothetical protein V6N12_029024 [Hibiscus sabdariffa]|uniref:Uncharacterized protein n=1 Tax=Hibiscus sabdariffa TaxID=183260 RepID=A0ABR2F7K9_9ROSI
MKINVFRTKKHVADTKDCQAIEATTEFDPDIEVTRLGREYLASLGRTSTESNNEDVHDQTDPETENRLIDMLKQHKKALGWTIADIKGISPAICMHQILLEDDHKPTVDAQRRLNQAMKDVVIIRLPSHPRNNPRQPSVAHMEPLHFEECHSTYATLQLHSRDA